MIPIQRRHNHFHFMARLYLATRRWEATGELIPGQLLAVHVAAPNKLRIECIEGRDQDIGDRIILTNCKLFVSDGVEQFEANGLWADTRRCAAPPTLARTSSTFGFPELLETGVLFRRTVLPDVETPDAFDTGVKVARVANHRHGIPRTIDVHYDAATGLPARLEEYRQNDMDERALFKAIVFQDWDMSPLPPDVFSFEPRTY